MSESAEVDYDKIVRWCRGLAEAQVTANGSKASFVSDMYFDAADAIEKLRTELAAERALVHYYRTLAQIASTPPHAGTCQRCGASLNVHSEREDGPEGLICYPQCPQS
jgi:hypothetical protein